MIALTVALLLSAAPGPEAVVGSATIATDVRAAPRREASVVGRLVPGQPVLTAREPVGGFRWVSTGAGLEGYVLSPAVKIESNRVEPEPATASQGATGTHKSAAPDLRVRPPTYAVTPEQLLVLVADDDASREAAHRLLAQQQAGTAVMWVSVIVGAGAALAASFMAEDARNASALRTARNVGRGGLALMSLGPLLGWAIVPGSGEIAEVASGWNGRHPESPIRVP